jgi:hypothetical protein
MTAPALNVVRALDDNVQPSIDTLDAEIQEMVAALQVKYVQRAALQALRDIRGLFNGGIA